MVSDDGKSSGDAAAPPQKRIAAVADELGVQPTDEAVARELDQRDPLASFRAEFEIPKVPPHHRDNDEESVYLCGNSLGCMPKRTAVAVQEELTKWGLAGVEGHFFGKRPWVTIDEKCAELSVRLVGAASSDEIVVMNSLSVNVHLLMAAFYKPEARRRKIMIEGNAFTSDQHIVRSQIEFHGGVVKDDLLNLEPREGESYLRDGDILDRIEKEGDEIALIMLGGVQFYSGQLFDLEAITRAGHAKGCVVGFDLAHLAGNVPVKLHEWNVDFAAWCSYKYLNSGPGGISGCFVHANHDNTTRKHFKAWWGQDPKTRFLMEKEHVPYPGAKRFQMSNPAVLTCVCLESSLSIFEEAGIERLRAKSRLLTGYLEMLIDARCSEEVTILTPRDPAKRGCQLSLKFKYDVTDVHKAITAAGVICDVRRPDVMRIAPVPLYNSFLDVWRFVQILRTQMDDLERSHASAQ